MKLLTNAAFDAALYNAKRAGRHEGWLDAWPQRHKNVHARIALEQEVERLNKEIEVFTKEQKASYWEGYRRGRVEGRAELLEAPQPKRATADDIDRLIAAVEKLIAAKPRKTKK